jgi:hypothetical protein
LCSSDPIRNGLPAPEASADKRTGPSEASAKEDGFASATLSRGEEKAAERSLIKTPCRAVAQPAFALRAAARYPPHSHSGLPAEVGAKADKIAQLPVSRKRQKSANLPGSKYLKLYSNRMHAG